MAIWRWVLFFVLLLLILIPLISFTQRNPEWEIPMMLGLMAFSWVFWRIRDRKGK